MHAYCSIRLHSLCQQEHFYSMHATEHRVPTIFNLQVWDNDVISDDYLGIANYSEIGYIFCAFSGKIEFDLHEMPLPAKSKRRCNLLLLDPNNRNNKYHTCTCCGHYVNRNTSTACMQQSTEFLPFSIYKYGIMMSSVMIT